MTTATKYKTYPKYKPSGIDWLGDIPEGWEAKRLRYFFDYHAGGVWGDEEKGDQNDLICLRVADFDFDHFALSDNDLTTRNIPENQHSRILEEGDILLEKSGGGEKQTVGRAVRFDSNDRAVCSNFIEKLTPLKVHNSKYISHLMGALYFGTINVRSIKQTTGIQNLDIYAYFCEVVPFPEKSIQQSIADFLDRETAKIDEMVAKKKKLIELLREKRQALITHAVTKGLDPKAKLKPSGIDWLGDIPEGWEVRRIKMLCKVSRGASPRPIDDEKYFDDNGEYSWVRIADLTASERYLKSTTQRLSNLGKSLSVPLEPGEIFLSIAGTVGSAIITKIKCCIHDGFVYFINLKYNRELLWYIFSAGEAYKGLGKLGTQLNLNTDTVGNIFIPIMGEDEQRKIVSFLDRETAKIDEMVKKKEMQIEKLQEYRQALITSAVTGKIMVN